MSALKRRVPSPWTPWPHILLNPTLSCILSRDPPSPSQGPAQEAFGGGASLAPEKTLDEMAADDAKAEADAAAYTAWRESRGERVELPGRQRVQAAPPVTAPFQFDADALARAARATAAPSAAM